MDECFVFVMFMFWKDAAFILWTGVVWLLEGLEMMKK